MSVAEWASAVRASGLLRERVLGRAQRERVLAGARRWLGLGRADWAGGDTAGWAGSGWTGEGAGRCGLGWCWAVAGFWAWFFSIFFLLSFLNYTQTKLNSNSNLNSILALNQIKEMLRHDATTKIKPMINFNYLRNKIRLNVSLTQ